LILNYQFSLFLSFIELARVSRSAFSGTLQLEILPYWFKTRILLDSLAKNIQMFLDYLQQDDFVGADMAESFTNGYTRSRRYANHKRQKIQTQPQKRKPKEASLKQEKIFYQMK